MRLGRWGALLCSVLLIVCGADSYSVTATASMLYAVGFSRVLLFPFLPGMAALFHFLYTNIAILYPYEHVLALPPFYFGVGLMVFATHYLLALAVGSLLAVLKKVLGWRSNLLSIYDVLGAALFVMTVAALYFVTHQAASAVQMGQYYRLSELSTKQLVDYIERKDLSQDARAEAILVLGVQIEDSVDKSILTQLLESHEQGSLENIAARIALGGLQARLDTRSCDFSLYWNCWNEKETTFHAQFRALKKRGLK